MHRLVSQLTLEEKAKLTVGIDRWQTAAIPRLGIPSIRMNDGPNGVRKEDETVYDEVNGTGVSRRPAFPASPRWQAPGQGALPRVAGELGAQAKALGVNVLLGPGINHKRTPIGGRNFEYFSEDPHLTGELAAEYVEGLQETGVACSLKHFYGNNTEYNRFQVDVVIGERARQEIYRPRSSTLSAAQNRVRSWRRTTAWTAPFAASTGTIFRTSCATRGGSGGWSYPTGRRYITKWRPSKRAATLKCPFRRRIPSAPSSTRSKAAN